MCITVPGVGELRCGEFPKWRRCLCLYKFVSYRTMHSVLTGGGLLEKCFFLNFFAQSPPLTPRMKKKIGVQLGAAEKVPENRQKVTKIEKKSR